MARQGSKLSGGRRERRRRKKDGFISNSNRRRPYLFLSRVRALARLLLAANFSRLEMREKGETSAESVERRRGWFVGEGGEEEAPRNYFFFFSRSFVCSQRPRKFESKRVSFFFFFGSTLSISLFLFLSTLSTTSLSFSHTTETGAASFFDHIFNFLKAQLFGRGQKIARPLKISGIKRSRTSVTRSRVASLSF
jgi:hypothetical protein